MLVSEEREIVINFIFLRMKGVFEIKSSFDK